MTITLPLRAVSTADQTLDHQLTQARAAGFDIACDHVICWITGLAGSRQGLQSVSRAGGYLTSSDAVTLLSCAGLIALAATTMTLSETIQRFMKRGVIIKTVINGFTFDGATKDPMQKAVRDALIGFHGCNGSGAGRGHEGRSEGRDRPCQGE